MSFMNGKPRIATAEETKFRWLCGRPGEYFRCCFCGHRFQVGDKWRCVYTNDMPGAGGNPLVCDKCDGPDVREKWKAKCDTFYRDDSWWWFRRATG